MYLFTRRTRIRGAAGLEWATKITAKVTEVTGQDVQLWGTVYSPAYGTITWTSWFADLPTLEAFGDKLQIDPGFQALAAEGLDHTEGGLDDGLLQTIYGEPDPNGDPQYVGGVQAVCSGGNIAKGMATGVEIAQKAEAATGLQTMFLRSMTGPYAAVGWLTGYADIAAVEKAGDDLAADASWLTYLDSTGDVFVEDAAITQQTMYRKLA